MILLEVFVGRRPVRCAVSALAVLGVVALPAPPAHASGEPTVVTLPQGVFLLAVPELDAGEPSPPPVGLEWTTGSLLDGTAQPRIGRIGQTVTHRATDAWQFGASAEVQFDRDARTGRLSNAYVSWGHCSANTAPLYLDASELLVTNEPMSCSVALKQRGPDVVELYATGTYRQLVAGVERVRFRMSQRFVALADPREFYVPSCWYEVIRGAWPEEWNEPACGHSEDAGVE